MAGLGPSGRGTLGGRGLPPRKLKGKKPGSRPPGPSRVTNDGPDGRMKGSKGVQVGYPIGGSRGRTKGRTVR